MSIFVTYRPGPIGSTAAAAIFVECSSIVATNPGTVLFGAKSAFEGTHIGYSGILTFFYRC